MHTTPKHLLQRLANDLNLAYPTACFSVYKETLLSKNECFGISFLLVNEHQYLIKILLKAEYANYFVHLDKNKTTKFQEKGYAVADYLQAVITLIEDQREALEVIKARWATDNHTLAEAIKSSEAIAALTGNECQAMKFPYLFTTKKDYHQINVSAGNRINIKTFDISLEQALKIIKILQNNE